MSSDGNYYPVTKVFENDFDGYLSSILSSTMTNPVLATPEHPFMVMRGTHKEAGCGPKCNQLLKAGNHCNTNRPDITLLPSGRWHARITHNYKRNIIGTFDSRDEAYSAVMSFKDVIISDKHKLEWDEAENIVENDWLRPVWNKMIVDMHTIDIPEQFIKKSRPGIKRNGVTIFNVDEEFMWILGIYLAEGSCGKRTVHFALHKDETVYQQRILAFFANNGFNGVVRHQKGNGVVVDIHSTSLAEWEKMLHKNNTRILHATT
jgi:hypothetical protein